MRKSVKALASMGVALLASCLYQPEIAERERKYQEDRGTLIRTLEERGMARKEAEEFLDSIESPKRSQDSYMYNTYQAIGRKIGRRI